MTATIAFKLLLALAFAAGIGLLLVGVARAWGEFAELCAEAQEELP